MTKIILKIEGMHCKSCEIILKEELEEISGVENVMPNNEKDEIELNFDGTDHTLNLIKKTIQNEGYTL
ncbi:heavy-metal-associated domain-containing protein [archaeon]|jgi:copper chaperone CopZ|nr:heavy-metal-associated domain-containing protein [archaeon]